MKRHATLGQSPPPALTASVDGATVRCFFPTTSRTLDAVPLYRSSRWLTLAALAVMGCGGPFPQSTLAPASGYAREIDGLFGTVFKLMMLVFVVVEVLLLFTIIRHRHRPGAAAPQHTHGHTVLEIAWTIAPALILVFVAVPTIQTIFRTQAPPPADALKIQVVAHQWWWEYRYPGGVVTANELHVPLGRTVDLEMTSADVIHSFWAPRLFGKRDVIPGHTNHIVFAADSIGEYMGQCVEFCGASHANMRLRVLVDSDTAFAAWTAAQAATPRAPAKNSVEQRGQDAFRRYGCIGCHTVTGVSTGVIGPNLTHVGSRTTIAGGMLPSAADMLGKWIENPQGVKPGALMPRMGVKADDMTALVAYLQSLK